MHALAKFVLIAFSLICFHTVTAQSVEIPSCYTKPSIQLPPKDSSIQSSIAYKGTTRSILVLIDETSVLPDGIISTALKINESLFKPLLADTDRSGAFFQIVRFSTFTDGKFSSTLLKGEFEGGASLVQSEANSLPQSKVKQIKNSLTNLSLCISEQTKFGLKRSDEIIKSTLKNGSSSIPKSDIITAIQQVSSVLKDQPSKEKVLVIISDMMEHSAYTSFYDKLGDLKDIVVEEEIKALQSVKAIPDLKGVKIWIVGGGYFANLGDKSGVRTRDQRKIAELERFWQRFFSISKAELKEFGKPDILGRYP